MRRFLWCLGLINVVALGAHAALSYVQAGAAHYQTRAYGQIDFHTKLGDRIAAFVVEATPRGLLLSILRRDSETQGSAASLAHDDDFVIREFERRTAWAIGGDWLQPAPFLQLYSAPILASTAIALLALFVVARQRSRADDAMLGLLLKWSVVFAVVMTVALPVVSSDFWLSFAWGRTLWWGGTPYHDVPAQAVAGLPFDAPVATMTSGPLWALVVWTITAVTRGSLLWGSVLLKLVVVASWSVALWLLTRILKDRPVWERCAAVILAGWLPLGAIQVGGEGQNVALTLAAVFGWLFLGNCGRARWATLVLALAVAVQPMVAPLFALDAVRARDAHGEVRSVRGTLIHYLPSAGVAAGALLFLVLMVPGSAGFLTNVTGSGYAYLPQNAISAITAFTGLGAGALGAVVFCTILAVALWAVARYWKRPGFDNLRLAVFGAVMSVVFLTGHPFWPWHALLLTVTAALLLPNSRLGLWGSGLAIAAPFPILLAVTHPDSSQTLTRGMPSLAMYLAAIVWIVIARMVFASRLVTPRQSRR